MKRRRTRVQKKTQKRKKPRSKANVSGLLGERITVRKSNNRVVVTNQPKRKKAKLTTALRVQRKNFKMASLWAIGQAEDPESRELYAKGVRGKHESPYTVALADYMNSPEVDSIDTGKYKGTIGDVLNIKAFDEFEVTKVEVKIVDAKGNVVEQGEASADPTFRLWWQYKAVAANPSRAGTKITAIAYDRPGNTGTKEVVL
jgi:DNA-binding beta-propeller fold protein YncE